MFLGDETEDEGCSVRLIGWWAHNRESRFQMDNGWLMLLLVCTHLTFLIIAVLDLQPGAKGFQLSNLPVLECSCLRASLRVFDRTSMSQLTCKSRILTGYLELLLENVVSSVGFTGQGEGKECF